MNTIQMLKDVFRKKTYKLVDDYVIRDGKKHPVAFICPGGGYVAVSSFVEGVPFAKKLNSMGISAVIVYYRAGKYAAYPAPQDDLAKAIRTVLDRAEEYHIDPENYSVWGCSAGGHLAASFGTENMGYQHYGLPKPACLVLAYPVITMYKDLTNKSSHDRLLGEDADLEQESFASVQEHVTSDYPKTFLWCGSADSGVSPENSHMMDRALTAAGIVHRFICYPGVEHGVGLGEGTAAEGWLEKAVHFWQGAREK